MFVVTPGIRKDEEPDAEAPHQTGQLQVALTGPECLAAYMMLLRDRQVALETHQYAAVRIIDSLHLQLGAPGAEGVCLNLQGGAEVIMRRVCGRLGITGNEQAK